MENELRIIAQSKGYPYKRHIFLCAAKGPCTDGQPVDELWSYLKQRLHEIEPDQTKATIGRSTSGCLRICKKGPIAIVYPEGTMYYDLTKNKLEEIIVNHLVGGNIVEKYTFINKKA